jgi:glycine reductase
MEPRQGRPISLKGVMSPVFDGKLVIALGERDGVAGPAIAACVKAAGSEVVFSATECFV